MEENRFEQALAEVEAGVGPTSSHLTGLSHLTREQAIQFERSWERLSVARKLALLRALSELEAASLRLEFNEVYHLGIRDEQPEVRRRAIESVVEDHSQWLLDRLLALLTDDPEPEIRVAAAAALAGSAQRAELGELSAEDAARTRATLLAALRRPGEAAAVRAEVLAAIGYFSDDEAQREVLEAYRDPSPFRLRAIEAMGHSADPAWLDTLTRELESEDDTTRQVAVRAMGEIGDEAAVTSLAELVDDPHIPVRVEAIGALGAIGGDEAREALIYALEDKRPAVREAAVAALEMLESNEDPLSL